MQLKREDVLKNIREKITEESTLLAEVSNNIDDAFFQAVKLICECKGKVVISGVGKSGHIGKKIAASLSCLGTPSFFMHSDEALHGDVGMVDEKDVVILISNGGKTDEVLKMIPSLNILGPKKISITNSNDSPLAKMCDVSLCVKVDHEIDHLHLAPTASALAVLAVGDALAATVSELKEFDRKSFAVRHPMGALGQQLLKEYKEATEKKEKSTPPVYDNNETVSL